MSGKTKVIMNSNLLIICTALHSYWLSSAAYKILCGRIILEEW
jgi:hypothetical protein